MSIFRSSNQSDSYSSSSCCYLARTLKTKLGKKMHRGMWSMSFVDVFQYFFFIFHKMKMTLISSSLWEAIRDVKIGCILVMLVRRFFICFLNHVLGFFLIFISIITHHFSFKCVVMNTYTGLASSSDFFKAPLNEDNNKFHVLNCFYVILKRILRTIEKRNVL